MRHKSKKQKSGNSGAQSEEVRPPKGALEVRGRPMSDPSSKHTTSTTTGSEFQTKRRLPYNDFVSALILLGALWVAYSQVWHAGFIWDDDAHLTSNACIVGPLGLKDIWITSAATYYPLVLTTFWIEHAIWGLNPLPYHLVNLAMHSACAVLIWKVLRDLKVSGAWFGAALWALHPIQVESVAWITELKNTQSCFFYLLAIVSFLKWRTLALRSDKITGIVCYTSALICATFAILSKTSTVMLPAVLGLCWWWREKRFRWSDAAYLVPFLFVSLIGSAWTVWEQKYHSGAIGQDWSQGFWEHIAIAGKVFWFYLAKLIWPHPLIFIYPRWRIQADNSLEYLGTLAAIGLLIFLWRRRNGPLRPLFFVTAYYAVSLFPVMGFFSIYFFRYSFVADHFAYLASIGPLGGAGAFIWTSGRLLKNLPPIGHSLVCSLILALLVSLTWHQTEEYGNNAKLWRATISKDPACWMAYNNIGFADAKEGELDDAISEYERALDINPNYSDAHYNLGFAFQQKGQFADAVMQYERAIEIEPDNFEAHNNLGNILMLAGKLDESIVEYQKALNLNPNEVEAHSNLGNVLSQKGRYSEAIQEYQKALVLEPEYAEIHYNLGLLLSRQGQLAGAIKEYQATIQEKPTMPEPYNNLAYILSTSPKNELRNGAQALDLAKRANMLTGGRKPEFLRTLAAAYAEVNRFDAATEIATQAVQLTDGQNNALLRASLQRDLQSYRADQPLREN
jgi:protein O-mannosyl-transferase